MGRSSAIRGVKLDFASVRLYVSAGDALSVELFETWQERFSHQILDGLGSTECLHIFMSAEPGEAVGGEIGTAIPPYEARLVDDDGEPLPPGGTRPTGDQGPSKL